jgi:hypothetical protein
LIHAPLKLIDLDLKLLALLLEITQLSLQGQQMRLHGTRGVIPFRLREWKTPGGMFSLGEGRHDS